MANNRGKVFEEKFKTDFLKVPYSTIDRLYDVTNGYRNIKQVADFIGVIGDPVTDMGLTFYLECKSHAGASIPIDNITQYDKLITKIGIPGVRSGVVLWLYDKDKVLYIPADTLKKLKEDGEKSIGIRHLDKYHIVEVPSVKRRVFMDSDYSILRTI